MEGAMRALDLMTSSVRVVDAEDPVSRAMRVMTDWEVGLLPVVMADAPFRVVGVITAGDIATRCADLGHTSECLVRDHMTATPLVSVGPEASVDEVLDRMRTHQLRRVLVLQGMRLLGIITLEDIERKIGHLEPRKVQRLSEALAPPLPA
jgi:CBS domain-containing protein